MVENMFPKLCDPCKIGTLEIRNRIVLPPMTTNFADQGFVSERLKDTTLGKVIDKLKPPI